MHAWQHRNKLIKIIISLFTSIASYIGKLTIAIIMTSIVMHAWMHSYSTLAQLASYSYIILAMLQLASYKLIIQLTCLAQLMSAVFSVDVDQLYSQLAGYIAMHPPMSDYKHRQLAGQLYSLSLSLLCFQFYLLFLPEFPITFTHYSYPLFLFYSHAITYYSWPALFLKCLLCQCSDNEVYMLINRYTQHE